MNDREFWMLVRQALLIFLSAIEKRYGFEITTELRKKAKEIAKLA